MQTQNCLEKQGKEHEGDVRERGDEGSIGEEYGKKNYIKYCLKTFS